MASASSRPIEFPFTAPPGVGDSLEVAPGVHWIRMPMPVVPGHINLWALADADGWTLVDTGFDCEEVRDAWLKLKKGLLSNGPVKRLIVTHGHRDHCGLSDWLTESFGCPLLMSEPEFRAARHEQANKNMPVSSSFLEFYRKAGMPPRLLDELRCSPHLARFWSPIPQVHESVEDNEVLSIGGRPWQVLMGYGHSPEHVCLYCHGLGVFISGDQLLPRTVSNVSVKPEQPTANPLARWIATLQRLHERLPLDTLTLPAHELPFQPAVARIDEMLGIHALKLEQMLGRLADSCLAYDLLNVIFRRTPPDRLMPFALGAILAHLNLLMERGQIQVSIDSEGRDWYQAV